MAGEKLLTIREVSQLLNISEREVIELAEEGKLPAYKIGGIYLRFKREQVEEFKKRNLKKSHLVTHSFRERFREFIYFNDFYILTAFIILWMLIIILGG